MRQSAPARAALAGRKAFVSGEKKQNGAKIPTLRDGSGRLLRSGSDRLGRTRTGRREYYAETHAAIAGPVSDRGRPQAGPAPGEHCSGARRAYGLLITRQADTAASSAYQAEESSQKINMRV